MKISGIYKITNSVNGKIYIGQSIDIEERWYQHKYKAFDEKEKGYNSAIHAAMRKYGIENFSIEIIEKCESILLDERERFWIKELNCLSPNGYNILEGGQGQRKEAHVCCDCGIQIYRTSLRCQACHAIHQQKVKLSFTALELAKSIKEKGFSGVGKEYGVTDNTVKKWCTRYGIPNKKAEVIDWYNKQMGIIENKSIKKPSKIPVNQLDLQTREVIQTFESATAAARSLGREKGSHITEVCKGIHKQAYGFGWEYSK